MNDKMYDEEMFDYLTREDNYKVAIDLAENITSINDRLRREFWNMVTNELEKHVKDEKFIEGHQFDFIRERWFKIENEAWEYCLVGGDTQTIGIRLKDKFVDIEGMEGVIRLVLQEFQIEGVVDPKHIWICQDWFTGRPFPIETANNEIFRILPNNRKDEIDKAVDEYLLSIKKWISICDRINEEIRKNENQKESD